MATKTKQRARKGVDPDLLALKRQLAGAIQRKITSDKLTISGLAKKIGTGRSALRRVLDESNTSCTLHTMFATATGVGLRLKFETEPMSTDVLMGIAQAMVDAPTKTKAGKLREQFLDGFYGTTPANASSPTRQYSSRTHAALAAPSK